MVDKFVVVLPIQTLLANQYNSMFPMKRGWYSRMLWVYLSNGIAYKWNEGEPTEDDRRNLIVSEKIQIAYCEE
jgi:hypothetical protein